MLPHCNPHSNPVNWCYYDVHVTDEEAEAERGKVTSLKGSTDSNEEPGFKPACQTEDPH